MEAALREIRESDLEMILNWRTSEDVTRYMNTDPKLTLADQKIWFEAHTRNHKARYWLIEVDKQPAGLIYLEHIDWKQRTTSWGYYIGEKKLRSLSLAISLEMSLYDYVFDVLNFAEIHNEVFSLNEGVVKLHAACGCRIQKVVKDGVEKNGTVYSITHLSMTRDRWRQVRGEKNYTEIDFNIPAKNWLFGGVHHWGVAVADIAGSARVYSQLGWHPISEVTEDCARNVKIMFMKNAQNEDLIELIAPMNENSPVTRQLKMMRNVATPYHVCYEVAELEGAVEVLKASGFVQIEPAEPAAALSGRRVVFLLHKDVGLIELLEKKQ